MRLRLALLFVVGVFVAGCGKRPSANTPMTQARVREIIGIDASETLLVFRWTTHVTAANEAGAIMAVVIAEDGRLFRWGRKGSEWTAEWKRLDASEMSRLHAALDASRVCEMTPGLFAFYHSDWWAVRLACDGKMELFGSSDAPQANPDGPRSHGGVIAAIGREVEALAEGAKDRMRIPDEDVFKALAALERALDEESDLSGASQR